MPQSKNGENRIGLAFPLKLTDGNQVNADGKANRRLMACTDEEHIKQSIRAILLTGPRERVMRRDFGNRAGAYLYENIGSTTASLVKHEIRSAIERYEPRVELTDIKVSGGRQGPGVLSVEISYRVLSTDANDQLTLDLRR